MSREVRPVSTAVVVCDLCGKIIPDGTHAADTASLTHGYIANPVTERTKRVWFRWPDRDRPGLYRTWEQEQQAREMRVEWDFHAACLYELLKREIETKKVEKR